MTFNIFINELEINIKLPLTKYINHIKVSYGEDKIVIICNSDSLFSLTP